jgi:hypothetical protein
MWAFLIGGAIEGTLPTQIGLMTDTAYFGAYCDLTGTIPTEIGRWSDALHISLALNDFTGNIPSEIGRLTLLESLLLWGNRLAGTVPTELGMLTNLVELWLEGNDLTGIEDSIICESTEFWSIVELTADCLGDPPEIVCSCCTTCCDVDDTCEYM